MNDLQHAVILVESTSRALRLDSLLKTAGVSCKLIPVPRHLSSDCGVCLRIRRDDIAVAEEVLRAAQLEIDSIRSI